MVARPAGRSRRADPVRRPAQGVVAADDLSGARHAGDHAAAHYAQIFTFLVFLTFYVPCLSTFAVMLKTLGRKEAWFSVTVSMVSALLMAGTVRLVLEVGKAIT